MLRALVLVLVLANALFFAWTRGWLAPVAEPPQHGERNPERLAAQVRPESIGLLSPRAASAALSAARAASMAAGEGEECLEAGPFTAGDVAAAEALLVQAGLASTQWVQREQPRAATWALVLGPFPNADAQRSRSDELRKLNIAAVVLAEPPGLKGSLQLARYDSREAAEAALPAWAERGVRNARVATLAVAGTEQWLRFERSGSALREQLRSIKFTQTAATVVACGAAGR